MSTPKPPYQFPRQRPTFDAGDFEGDILIYCNYFAQWSFRWCGTSWLKPGHIWVPGCDEFFDDWTERVRGVTAKNDWANNHWSEAAAKAAEVKS